MIDLVEALLNVSRIEAGKIAIKTEPTNLGMLLDKTLADLRPKIVEAGLSLIVNKIDDIPEIYLDKGLIRNVFVNLISNAIKYTPKGGSIEISIFEKDGELLTHIKDTGVGIPEDAQGKVFKKFFRADNAKTLAPNGNGLGLYLIKAVVVSSGGKIWFTSKKEEGTSFWFSFPLCGDVPKEGALHFVDPV